MTPSEAPQSTALTGNLIMHKEVKGYLIIFGIAVAAIFVTFKLLPTSIRQMIVGA